jgi:hypothetical protein
VEGQARSSAAARSPRRRSEEGRARPADLLVAHRGEAGEAKKFHGGFSSRGGKNRGASLPRALAGAPDIQLSIAQTTARTKIFIARSILQLLLEGAKTRSALYIDGFFSARLVYSLCWRCS